ncbi:MAG: heavy metal translocating P-type ATPase [Mariprofundaceae bacterium]|nr:heavy metal translocating P-type ATPase [Mariprofundaceae bacterium]
MLIELLVIGGASYTLRNARQKKANQSSDKDAKKTKHKLLHKNSAVNNKGELKQFEERELRSDMAISTVSLTLSVLGNLVYAPLIILSIPGWIYVSLPAVMQAIAQLREKKVDVSILFTITFIACITAGYYATGNLAAFFYVLSKKLIHTLKRDSQQSLVDVFGQHPNVVWLLVDGAEVSLSFDQLKKGDVVVVSAGETIPADGKVVDGNASVDQHLLTGESQPIDKGYDDTVFAATVVISGKVYVQVEKAGEESTAAQIGQILNQTTYFKTEGERYADALTQQTIMPTLIVGLISLPLLGPMGAVTMINAHFGYRMAMTSSVVSLSYLQVIAHRGILIKSGEVLDLLPKVDTLVFDKTGTLTMPQPTLGTIHAAEGFSENDVLAYAATAEYKQTHPIAMTLLAEAQRRGLTIAARGECAYQVGFGLLAQVGKRHIHLGSKRFMEHEQIIIADSFLTIYDEAESKGYSVVMLAVDGQVVGAIEMHASVRPEAKKVIASLKRDGLIKTTYIISGDSEAPTQRLSDDLGIDHYYAGVLPQHKADIIEQLQAEGKTVCYIGDGINDAIALKRANVSISMRGAATVATDTAQIVLMNENLNQLYYLLDIGDAFTNTMKGSCRSILIPSLVAAGGVLFLGVNLTGTILLKQIGLTVAMVKATQPLLKHHTTSSRLHMKPSVDCNHANKK